MRKILLILMAILGFAAYATADIPHTLNYQGRLMNQQNQPVADGQYAVSFHLYDSEAGGTEQWAELQNVNTNNGYFNTVLGNKTTLAAAYFDKPLWLGIKAGSNAEMVPRQKLGTAAYAMNIVDGSISTNKIVNQSVTTDKVANGAVTSEKISDGSITSSKLSGSCVQTGHLSNQAVTTNKISNHAVTNAWSANGFPNAKTASTNWENINGVALVFESSGADLLVSSSYSFYFHGADSYYNVQFRLKIDEDYFCPGVEGHQQRIRDQIGRNIYQSGQFSSVVSSIPAGEHTMKLQCKAQRISTSYPLGEVHISDESSISLSAIELKR